MLNIAHCLGMGAQRLTWYQFTPVWGTEECMLIHLLIKYYGTSKGKSILELNLK